MRCSTLEAEIVDVNQCREEEMASHEAALAEARLEKEVMANLGLEKDNRDPLSVVGAKILKLAEQRQWR